MLLTDTEGSGNVHLPRKHNYLCRTCGRSIYFIAYEIVFQLPSSFMAFLLTFIKYTASFTLISGATCIV
ncbi:Nitrate/nitrite sensor protein [Citrobacter freundii]|uniref:Nitrate/nitrite sensor protein n=1 Tax=Citrobacter freundii TaxID=546 RepID=A0A7G2IY26_CITFR|nr:Nitrate/nitrite sensor protein [Citrobacter freundii]